VNTDSATVAELLQRVSLLERKVSHLYKIAQRDEPDFDSGAVSEEVMRLVEQNRTIEAIQLHREQTGIGLAAAKAAIDSLGATS
jgi:ribosomal protein L7/L12